jgi:hypothetical protein
MKNKVEKCDVQKDEQYFRLRALCHTVYVALSVHPLVGSLYSYSHGEKQLWCIEEFVLNAF